MKKEDIRKGDKIRVSYSSYGAELTVTGVAHTPYGICSWETQAGANLCVSRDNATIELLERPKTPEEILTERKDRLVTELIGASGRYEYCTDLARKLVDRIIEMEDAK